MWVKSDVIYFLLIWGMKFAIWAAGGRGNVGLQSPYHKVRELGLAKIVQCVSSSVCVTADG